MWHPEKSAVIIFSLASYTGLKWDFPIKQIVRWGNPSGIKCDHTCTPNCPSCPMGLLSLFHCYSQSKWTSNATYPAHGRSCKKQRRKATTVPSACSMWKFPKTEMTEINIAYHYLFRAFDTSTVSLNCRQWAPVHNIRQVPGYSRPCTLWIELRTAMERSTIWRVLMADCTTSWKCTTHII